MELISQHIHHVTPQRTAVSAPAANSPPQSAQLQGYVLAARDTFTVEVARIVHGGLQAVPANAYMVR